MDRRGNYDSDNDDDIWILPDYDDDNDDDNHRRQPTQTHTLTAKSRLPLETVRTDNGSMIQRPAIRPVGIMRTMEVFEQQQAIATFISTLITSHPMHTSLTMTDKVVVLRVDNPRTKYIDSIYCRGITAPLKEKIWPRIRFHRRPARNPDGSGHITGTPYVYEDTQGYIMDVDDMGNGQGTGKAQQPRRSWQTINHDTLETGLLTHRKFEMYNRVYIDSLRQYGNTAKVTEIFRNELRIMKLGESVKDMEDIDAILNLYNLPEYQFIPVAAELPVCDAWKIDTYLQYRNDRNQRARMEKAMGVYSPHPPATAASKRQQLSHSPSSSNLQRMGSSSPSDERTYTGPVLYGTPIDALVFCPRQGALGFIELKTSHGDFVKSSNNMEWPLNWLTDSALNCAYVQLALGIEYFKRTYGHILKENNLPTNLYGFIVVLNLASDNSVIGSEIYTLTPELQEKIINSLKATDFLG
jgi:hypothetical protein